MKKLVVFALCLFGCSQPLVAELRPLPVPQARLEAPPVQAAPAPRPGPEKARPALWHASAGPRKAWTCAAPRAVLAGQGARARDAGSVRVCGWS